MKKQPLLEKVEKAQNQLIAWATGETWDEAEYKQLRKSFGDDPLLKKKIPRFLKTCRTVHQFWNFMKKKSDTYQGRREFIWSEFDPLFEMLEFDQTMPADEIITDSLSELDAESVQSQWHRALQRRANDPEGAITLAKTLLESVCKSLLDEFEVEYKDNEKITNLYHKTANQMNLAPEQHTEETFRAILGNVQAVVQRLANIRNEFGDAHGDGKESYSPSSRHAELAVNIAGTTALFLVRTWNEKFRES